MSFEHSNCKCRNNAGSEFHFIFYVLFDLSKARAVLITEPLASIQFSIIYQPIGFGSHFLQFSKMQIDNGQPRKSQKNNQSVTTTWSLSLSMLTDFSFSFKSRQSWTTISWSLIHGRLFRGEDKFRRFLEKKTFAKFLLK